MHVRSFQRICSMLYILVIYGVQVVGDCINPTETWPLTKTTCSVPISFLQNTSSLCLGISGSFDSTSGIVPLSFSGTHSSYLDVSLTTTEAEIADDYGFSAYIKPSVLDGTILHYRTSDISATADTTDVMLKIVNGKLTVTRNFKGVTDEESITDELSGILSANQWYMVAFLVDISGGKVDFFLDNADTGKQGLGTNKNYRLSAPGILRVGSTIDWSNLGFNGLITCVQFHANKEKIFSRSACLTSCRNIPKAPLSFEKRQYGRFTLIGREVEPTDGHMTGGLVTAETWTDCSLKCLKDFGDCISFTAEPLTNGVYRCIMYDYIQFVNLVYASNKFYYRLQDYD